MALSFVANPRVSRLMIGSNVRASLAISSGGDVTGPATATDNAIVRFDGTSGKTIQNSTVTISDTGSIVDGDTTQIGILTGLYGESSAPSKLCITDGSQASPLTSDAEQVPAVSFMRWVTPDTLGNVSQTSYLFNTAWMDGTRTSNDALDVYNAFFGISGRETKEPTGLPVGANNSVIGVGVKATQTAGTHMDSYGVLIISENDSVFGQSIGTEIDITNFTGAAAPTMISESRNGRTIGLNLNPVVEGAGSSGNTVGILVNGAAGAEFDTGIYFRQFSIAATGYAIDLRKISAAVPILLANNNGLFSRNAADNANVSLIKLNASDQVVLGTVASITTPIVSGGSAADSSLILQSTSGTGTSDSVLVKTGAQSERIRVDTAGHVVIGGSAALAPLGITSNLQVLGASGDASSMLFATFQANTNSGQFTFAKSRHATLGSHTIVNDGDDVGLIRFIASNGTSFEQGAMMMVSIDGTPGAANDMPMRFGFFIAADGSSTPVERLRISNTTTAGDTFLVVYDVDNAALNRVTVGAPDSGGAGFKVLRIPN